MKFIVMYMAPAAVLAEWMQKPEEERKEGEAKMREEWNVWSEAHKDILLETNAAGKNMRVTKDGASEVGNDLMMYSIVEGESIEAVSEQFKGHPHFGIPEAAIEIMPIRPI